MILVFLFWIQRFQTIYLYVCHLNNISRLQYVIFGTKVISKGRGNRMFCCCCCWYVVWYDFKILNYTTIQPPHLSRKCTSVQTRPIPFSPHYILRYWTVLNFCWVYLIPFFIKCIHAWRKHFHSKKYTSFRA